MIHIADIVLVSYSAEFFVKQSGAFFGLYADAIAIECEPQPIGVGVRNFVVFQKECLRVFPRTFQRDGHSHHSIVAETRDAIYSGFQKGATRVVRLLQAQAKRAGDSRWMKVNQAECLPAGAQAHPSESCYNFYRNQVQIASIL
jgi:hypothetical protein